MNATSKQLLGWGTAWLAALAFLAVLLPGLLVKRIAGPAAPAQSPVTSGAGVPSSGDNAKVQPLLIPVYLSERQTIEKVPLEDYVRGVVAAEMPADFELEAMKAQALAARTYMVRRIMEQDFGGVPVQMPG
ncbi:SpoIID/LytB domain-containing protein [Gordoniibacillus kamchatkensis]|uniref:SpoIID/LytB domain-containing protein n=1 Tax=Gordoniibacillus kamchatkensis TaxID=1590651 RepID=UPI000A8B2F67|nr:SpoIID/LytB domain-containing protein [Paenibacillus sp. VKM B-2647]